MANELNIVLQASGLTVTANIYNQGWTLVTGAIACAEIGGSTGRYSGSVPAATLGDATYLVEFISAGVAVGRGLLTWESTGDSEEIIPDNVVDTNDLVNANLDVAVSTRNSVVPLAAATDQAEHDATQAAIAALNDIDIADVQTALTNQGYTAGRAPNLDNLDVAVSTRNSVTPLAAATDQAEHDATQAAIAALNDLDAQAIRDAMKLAPAGGAPAAGSVDEHLDDILADTSVMEPLVSTNLDATVSSRNSVTPLAAATDQAEHDATQAAIAALVIPTAVQNADALLNRDLSAVTVTNTRSPINAFRFLRNRWAVAGTTLTVYEEDDTTAAWTSTLTGNAAADPVVESDPV